MKYIHIVTLLLAALAALPACSPDSAEEVPEELVTPEPLPEPERNDVITITVGKNKTGEELLSALEWAQIHIGKEVYDVLKNPNFPASSAERGPKWR